MSSSQTIYVGTWTNWSKGHVKGATLTLPNQHGVVLIAALALFIQLAGGQSWRILSYIVYQIRTTRARKDGLYHQQQATLRNTSSDIGSLWSLAKLGWAWRSVTRRSARRSFGIVALAFVHLLAFTSAGILSSHFTSVGNDVLLARSSSCGIWNPAPDLADLAQNIAYGVYNKNMAGLSNQYVQNCLTQEQSLPECNVFRKSQLEWTIQNTTCPFSGGLCLGPTNASLNFDTGLIDSRDDLGINSRDANRIQYRKLTTCIPISTDDFVKVYNITVDQSTFEAAAAFYGPNYNPSSEAVTNGSIANATYVTSDFRNFELGYDTQTGQTYTIK